MTSRLLGDNLLKWQHTLTRTDHKELTVFHYFRWMDAVKYVYLFLQNTLLKVYIENK